MSSWETANSVVSTISRKVGVSRSSVWSAPGLGSSGKSPGFIPMISNSVMPPLMVVAFVSVAVISTSLLDRRRTMSPSSLAESTTSPGSSTFASMLVVMPISVVAGKRQAEALGFHQDAFQHRNGAALGDLALDTPATALDSRVRSQIIFMRKFSFVWIFEK